MINDDVLIKFARKTLKRDDWPIAVRDLKSMLYNIRAGFPGINNDCLSLVKYDEIGLGDIIIFVDFLPVNFSGRIAHSCPIMLEITDINTVYFHDTLPRTALSGKILGFGYGLDPSDPWRETRVGDMFHAQATQNTTIRVDCRPTETGGAGYYYFFKSYRDFRL